MQNEQKEKLSRSNENRYFRKKMIDFSKERWSFLVRNFKVLGENRKNI